MLAPRAAAASEQMSDFPCLKFGGEESIPYPVMEKDGPHPRPAEVTRGVGLTLPTLVILSSSLEEEQQTTAQESRSPEAFLSVLCALSSAEGSFCRLLPKCCLRFETRLGWPLPFTKFVSLKKFLPSAIFLVIFHFKIQNHFN